MYEHPSTRLVKMLPNRDVFTSAEIATALRVHKRTPRRWAEEGIIPAFKAGRQWRFLREHVVTYLLNADLL